MVNKNKISNKNLALLYNETKNKKNKEKIFLKLKSNLQEKTNKIINFWIKNFSDNYEKFYDYETYHQISDIILLDTLNIFPNTNDKFILEKWYIERLKNNIYDTVYKKNKINANEILVDFQNEYMENFIFNNNYDKIEENIDNECLYNILKTYIDKIKFLPRQDKSSEDFKNIFLDSIGFNESKLKKSFAELARLNNYTRQNIRDYCFRCKNKLIELLKKDNKLELLKYFL